MLQKLKRPILFFLIIAVMLYVTWNGITIKCGVFELEIYALSRFFQ